MNKTEINSIKFPAPDGGYSQAMLAEGVISLLFISGQIPQEIEILRLILGNSVD